MSETIARDAAERDVWTDPDVLNFEELDFSHVAFRRSPNLFDRLELPAPRSVTSEEERKLVRRIAWANVKQPGRKEDELWGLIARGDIDAVFDVESVARKFNLLYLDAFGDDGVREVVLADERFAHDQLRPKEATHIKTFLVSYAEAVVQRLQHPEPPQPAATRTAPLPRNAIIQAGGATPALPSIPVVAQHVRALAAKAAAAALPTPVPPTGLPAGAPLLRTTPAQRTASAPAAARRAPRDDDLDGRAVKRRKPGENLRCPHCGRTKHKENQGCALKSWMDAQVHIERSSRKRSKWDTVRERYLRDEAFRAQIRANEAAQAAAAAAPAPAPATGTAMV